MSKLKLGFFALTIIFGATAAIAGNTKDIDACDVSSVPNLNAQCPDQEEPECCEFTSTGTVGTIHYTEGQTRLGQFLN